MSRKKKMGLVLREEVREKLLSFPLSVSLLANLFFEDFLKFFEESEEAKKVVLDSSLSREEKVRRLYALFRGVEEDGGEEKKGRGKKEGRGKGQRREGGEEKEESVEEKVKKLLRF